MQALQIVLTMKGHTRVLLVLDLPSAGVVVAAAVALVPATHYR